MKNTTKTAAKPAPTSCVRAHGGYAAAVEASELSVGDTVAWDATMTNLVVARRRVPRGVRLTFGKAGSALTYTRTFGADDLVARITAAPVGTVL
jgi:hypothetical protein